MGIDDKIYTPKIAFDREQPEISMQLSIEKFTAHKLEQNHDVRLLKFYDGSILCTEIYADFTDETLVLHNSIDDPVKTAFGNRKQPIWADFQAFLEDRCIPRQRAGLREYLDVIGVGEYDPFAIIKKTAGRMAEDEQWIEIIQMK